MDGDLAILTPEKTVLTYRLAGPGGRITAHLLDAIILFALEVAVDLVIVYSVRQLDYDLAMALFPVLSLAIPILYFILFEGLWNGQTPGKKACNLRVRMADGTPVTFAAAIGRNLMRPADMLPFPYFSGLLAMFSNPLSQRIGDLVCGTVVCFENGVTVRAVPAPHTVGIHPYEEHVGPLRGMRLPEYVVLRRLADRFPELTPETQERLVREVWAPFAERRGVPTAEGVHPIFLVEAVVMKYGREHGLL